MSNPINVTLTKKVISVVTAGRGLRGYAVEIRVDSGYIQTKYEYETEWTNLIPLSALIGPQGLASYIHIKWHTEGSTILLDTPEAYIGIYADNTEADSTIYDDYQWYKTKGEKGDPGNMTGPASSVNENIPIFDGVTGDKLKDSGVKLSDKANVDDVKAAIDNRIILSGGVPA